MTTRHGRHQQLRVRGLVLTALLSLGGLATACEQIEGDDSTGTKVDAGKAVPPRPDPTPPSAPTAPPSVPTPTPTVSEYSLLYEAVVVALARPWTFDAYAQQNANRFDGRFQRCMAEKRNESVRAQTTLGQVCASIYPPDPNATACRAASEAANRVRLFDDMAATLAGLTRYDATGTGAYIISLADAFGRDSFAALMEQELARAGTRQDLMCWL